MLFKFVTSMNQAIYDTYGKDMLVSFDKFWPEGEMWVYTEEVIEGLEDLSERITRKALYEVEGAKHFLDTLMALPMTRGEVVFPTHTVKDYRYNAAQFSRKALAQCDAACDHEGYMFWIDADVITDDYIPGAMLEDMMMGKFIAVMKRPEWHSLCTSFIGWDTNHAIANDWFNMYYITYMSGNFLTLEIWDDAFVLTTVIKSMEAEVNDIASEHKGEGPYNVFDLVFAGKARHLKGALKESHGGPARYSQLMKMVSELKPKVFMEFGTWNGDRAVEVHQLSPDTEYIGFDLFETANEETDEAEKNVKAHNDLNDVRRKLTGTGMKYRLFRGDSKETFPDCLKSLGSKKVDMIWIDGGHSVETIQADYENAKKVVDEHGVIIFDDYYTEMPDEDLEKFGAQKILKDIEHIILPIADPVKGGGKVQIALVC